jgi:uncharacterized protein YjiK
MIILACLLSLTLISPQVSQDNPSPTIRFPYEWIGPQGLGGYINIPNFPEPSGICFHPTRKTLFVVCDEGEIAEIKTDGSLVFRKKIPGDLEAITVDPSTGFLYIVKEADDIILEFDPEKKEILKEFPINRTYQDNPNYLEKKTEEYDNGVESITFVPDEKHSEGGTFFIGNQWDPPCILEIYVPLKTTKKNGTEARIIRVLPYDIDDPAAMFFDPMSKLLNVVSDADNILVELTLEGKLVNEYAFPGEDQEGLTRDDEGVLYIAQDSGNIMMIRDLRVKYK